MNISTALGLRNSNLAVEAEDTVVTIDVGKPPQANGGLVEVKIQVRLQ